MKRKTFALIMVLILITTSIAAEDTDKPINTFAQFSFSWYPAVYFASGNPRHDGTFPPTESAMVPTSYFSSAVSVQLGLNLWKDWKFLLNTDFGFGDSMPGQISQIAGAFGWKYFSIMLRNHTIRGKFNWDGFQFPSREVFTGGDFSFNMFTADFQFDIMGAIASLFDENYSGLYLGFSYNRFKVPVALDLVKYKDYVSWYEPALRFDAIGFSIYWDSMLAAMRDDSSSFRFTTARNTTYLLWINFYWNMIFGEAEADANTMSRINNDIYTLGIDQNDIGAGFNILSFFTDMTLGLARLIERDNYNMNIGIGYNLNFLLLSGKDKGYKNYDFFPNFFLYMINSGIVIKAGFSY